MLVHQLQYVANEVTCTEAKCDVTQEESAASPGLSTSRKSIYRMTPYHEIKLKRMQQFLNDVVKQCMEHVEYRLIIRYSLKVIHPNQRCHACVTHVTTP